MSSAYMTPSMAYCFLTWATCEFLRRVFRLHWLQTRLVGPTNEVACFFLPQVRHSRSLLTSEYAVSTTGQDDHQV